MHARTHARTCAHTCAHARGVRALYTCVLCVRGRITQGVFEIFAGMCVHRCMDWLLDGGRSFSNHRTNKFSITWPRTMNLGRFFLIKDINQEDFDVGQPSKQRFFLKIFLQYMRVPQTHTIGHGMATLYSVMTCAIARRSPAVAIRSFSPFRSIHTGACPRSAMSSPVNTTDACDCLRRQCGLSCSGSTHARRNA